MENEALILDLIEWLGAKSRPYPEVMNAWRTSCPRLTIWEDATDLGYVVVHSRDRRGELWVSATSGGRQFLAGRRPPRSG